MEPPMNSNSKHAATRLTAVHRPAHNDQGIGLAGVFQCLFQTLWVFAAVLELQCDLTGITSWPISEPAFVVQEAFRRARAPMRWWWPQPGHTFWFCSRSVSVSTASQLVGT